MKTGGLTLCFLMAFGVLACNRNLVQLNGPLFGDPIDTVESMNTTSDNYTFEELPYKATAKYFLLSKAKRLQTRW